MPAAEHGLQLAPRPATSTATTTDPADPSRCRRVGPIDPAPPPPPPPAAPAQPAPPRGRVPAFRAPPAHSSAPASTPPPAWHKHRKPQQNRPKPSHPVRTVPARPSRHQPVSAAEATPTPAQTPLWPRRARPGRPSRPEPPTPAPLPPAPQPIRRPAVPVAAAAGLDRLASHHAHQTFRQCLGGGHGAASPTNWPPESMWAGSRPPVETGRETGLQELE